MRVSRLKTSLLLSTFLLTLLSVPIIARADDEDDADDYDVKSRVVRISLVYAEVNLKRNGNSDWEPARLNSPLVEGDTVATGKSGNLELQFDSRNFVRVAGNSVLRIITLRDEGIAISVVQGTIVVRLSKFDRQRGYFEIDAPKTTMAVEKDGLYRVDVPPEGNVRLTVRDGGSARIYSDTSGFALRDGRSAELVATGDNAGDWDLLAAAPPDPIDDWVRERERYLAQHSQYDVKYYDENVWGGEDLEAYGDWINTDAYGWIWRPHASVISAYPDWAPYRYGQWTWCPPYGWTWVGSEPWGWAPYHYGRWVYYNNYWAWVARTQYTRKRSWWRPALVAFFFNVSFGNDICWYPLSYYQPDPYSRHYRRHYDRDRDRHPGSGYGRPGNSPGRDGRPYDDPRHWRGVTRVPRREFGNPERRGEPVAEPVARRVFQRDPERADLPRRGAVVSAPVIQISDQPTGAAERAPGVPLDQELRRNRVFRGREPRTGEPAPAQTDTNASPATTPAQPTGAVARPEPRPSGEPRSEPPDGSDQPRLGPGRLVRPTLPEGEKRGRGQLGIEAAPRNPPQPSAEQPAPAVETPRERPRVERRERETPVTTPETTPEARPERRPESQPESQPESRPRFEPRPEPRSESRESRPETQSESPRSESPRPEPSRSEAPRPEPPRPEPPRSESPRSEPSRSESPRSESPRSESPRSESPRSEPSRSEAPRSEPPRSEAPRSEPSRSESPRSESPRTEAPRPSVPDRPRPDRPRL